MPTRTAPQPAPTYETLLVERSGGVDRLTLNRPAQYNAVNPAMATELADYFNGLTYDEQVRVVVLQGAGRHFCAGFDLDHLDAIVGKVADGLRVQRQMAALVLAMRRCPQPIIGLIHGAAVGAGFAIALAADVRYVSDDARMNVAMAKDGLTGCEMLALSGPGLRLTKEGLNQSQDLPSLDAVIALEDRGQVLYRQLHARRRGRLQGASATGSRP